MLKQTHWTLQTNRFEHTWNSQHIQTMSKHIEAFNTNALNTMHRSDSPHSNHSTDWVSTLHQSASPHLKHSTHTFTLNQSTRFSTLKHSTQTHSTHLKWQIEPIQIQIDHIQTSTHSSTNLEIKMNRVCFKLILILCTWTIAHIYKLSF